MHSRISRTGGIQRLRLPDGLGMVQGHQDRRKRRADAVSLSGTPTPYSPARGAFSRSRKFGDFTRLGRWRLRAAPLPCHSVDHRRNLVPGNPDILEQPVVQCVKLTDGDTPPVSPHYSGYHRAACPRQGTSRPSGTAPNALGGGGQHRRDYSRPLRAPTGDIGAIRLWHVFREVQHGVRSLFVD